MGRNKKFPPIPKADVIERFLRRYNSVMVGQGDRRKYWEALHGIVRKEIDNLWIDLDDLECYSAELANHVSHDVNNYTKLFIDIAAHIYYGLKDSLPQEPEENQEVIDVVDDDSGNDPTNEPLTSLVQQTTSEPIITPSTSETSGTQCSYRYFVCSEIRPFKLFFRPLSKKRCTSIRALDCTGSNQLVTVRAVVKEVMCFERMIKSRRTQRLKKFQEFTLIEPLDQVPVGSVAKTIRAVSTDDCITAIDAGDHIVATAVLLPYFVELDEKTDFNVDKMIEVQHIEIIEKVKLESYDIEMMKLRPKRKKKKSTVGYCELVDISCQTDFDLLPGEPQNYVDLESEHISENLSENPIENFCGDASENLPGNLSGNLSGDLSENPKENSSEDLSEDLSENLPENLSELQHSPPPFYRKFSKMTFKFRIPPRCTCP